MIRWFRRVSALLVGAVVGALLPAVAWAHTHPTVSVVADELARRRIRRHHGGTALGGIIATIICGLVVFAIIFAIIRFSRRPDKR